MLALNASKNQKPRYIVLHEGTSDALNGFNQRLRCFPYLLYLNALI